VIPASKAAQVAPGPTVRVPHPAQSARVDQPSQDSAKPVRGGRWSQFLNWLTQG
jgi:hypothetical protein